MPLIDLEGPTQQNKGKRSRKPHIAFKASKVHNEQRKLQIQSYAFQYGANHD